MTQIEERFWRISFCLISRKNPVVSAYDKNWFDERGTRVPAGESHGAFIQTKIGDHALCATVPDAALFALQHLGWVRATIHGMNAEIESDPLYVQTESWAAAASYLAGSGARRFRIKSRCQGNRDPWSPLRTDTQPSTTGQQAKDRADALESGIRSGQIVDLTAYTSPSQYQVFESPEAFQRGATLILIGLQQRLQKAAFISKRLHVEEITLPDMREIIVDWHYKQGRIHPDEWDRFWMSENLDSSIISTVGNDMEIRYAWIGDAIPLPDNQTRDSLRGKRILDLADPDYAARTWLHYEEVVKNKRPTFHAVELCIQGKIFEYTRLAMPCFDPTGRVSHVISNSRVSSIYEVEWDIDTAL